MPNPPNPTNIFHITPIANLRSLARSGELLSKTVLTTLGLAPANIAYQQIQDRRAARGIPIQPGGTLHDYVPFHFAPRSPMLKTVDSGNVPGCDFRQEDIVHVVSSTQIIRDAGLPYVFTDIHAVLSLAKFFSDLAQLDQIDWTIFFEEPKIEGYCEYWANRDSPARYVTRRETRQAEFLVFERVPLTAVIGIGVHSAAAEERVKVALANTAWAPPIKVIPGWYY